MKHIVFNTFPREWRVHYKQSACDIRTDTINDIVTYMNTQKGIADEASERNHRSSNTSRKRDNTQSGRGRSGGRNSSQGRGNSQQSNKRQRQMEAKMNEPCCTHNGAHQWGDCPLNWRNQQHQGRGGRGGRNGGRGSFRGGRGGCGGGPYHQQPQTYYQINGQFVPSHQVVTSGDQQTYATNTQNTQASPVPQVVSAHSVHSSLTGEQSHPQQAEGYYQFHPFNSPSFPPGRQW